MPWGTEQSHYPTNQTQGVQRLRPHVTPAWLQSLDSLPTTPETTGKVPSTCSTLHPRHKMAGQDHQHSSL